MPMATAITSRKTKYYFITRFIIRNRLRDATFAIYGGVNFL